MEKCQDCGQKARIVIRPTRIKPQIMEYFDEHLNAYITGPAQKKRIMREKNLEEKG